MKSLKFGQKLVLIITLLIGVFLLVLYWYKQNDSVRTIQTYEVNSPSLDRKLLIATQGSPFKDSITAVISERYKSTPISVEVIDIAALSNTEAADSDAILLIFRWEAGAPPETVQSFMDKNLKLKNKMVVLTTSWNGLEKMKNVDAITGASIIDDVPFFSKKIIKDLDRLLKYKN